MAGSFPARGQVNEVAAAGFARSAEDYERARPDYPRNALEWLARQLELGRGRTVVDLAAGTGKLSRPLAATGARVVAVEPLPEMRAFIDPPIEVLDGTAESMPLADSSADAVTVAQAFHWFDGDAALAEIHRVLRPGGRLALVWNRRAPHDPLNTALDELLAPYRGDVPSHRGDRWQAAFERTSLFGPLERREFANSQELDPDGLALRVASISFIASLPEPQREDVLRRARGLAGGGTASVPYTTEVHLCRALPN